MSTIKRRNLNLMVRQSRLEPNGFKRVVERPVGPPLEHVLPIHIDGKTVVFVEARRRDIRVDRRAHGHGHVEQSVLHSQMPLCQLHDRRDLGVKLLDDRRGRARY